jgi:hypothetical protein
MPVPNLGESTVFYVACDTEKNGIRQMDSLIYGIYGKPENRPWNRYPSSNKANSKMQLKKRVKQYTISI